VVTSMEGTQGSWLIGSPHVPTWLHLGVLIPLDLIEPSSLVACDSVLLVEDLNGICLVRQIRFQWDGVFNNHVCRGLQTSLELEDMKQIMNP
jgi:hypothetical protein